MALVSEEVLLTDLAYAEDLQAAPNGDFDVVSGMSNVSAALFRRIMTIPGTLAHAPTYGAGLLSYQGAPMTLAQKQQIAQKIAEQVVLDPRVESFTSVGFSSPKDNPQMLILTLKVKIIGQGEQEMTYIPFDGEAV